MGTPHYPRVVTEKGWGRALICGICPFCGLNNPAKANFKQLRFITNLQKSWICSIRSSSKPARTGPDTSQDAPSSAPQGPSSPALLRVLASSARWQQDGSSCSYYHNAQRKKKDQLLLAALFWQGNLSQKLPNRLPLLSYCLEMGVMPIVGLSDSIPTRCLQQISGDLFY